MAPSGGLVMWYDGNCRKRAVGAGSKSPVGDTGE